MAFSAHTHTLSLQLTHSHAHTCEVNSALGIMKRKKKSNSITLAALSAPRGAPSFCMDKPVSQIADLTRPCLNEPLRPRGPFKSSILIQLVRGRAPWMSLLDLAAAAWKIAFCRWRPVCIRLHPATQQPQRVDARVFCFFVL